MDITAVPRTPAHVKGVINLRGKVIPVVDLRLKFGMSEAEHTDETCIIVVQVGSIEMGILVDKVSEVLNIQAKDIEDAPSFGTEVNTDFILGMGKAKGKVTITPLDYDLTRRAALDEMQRWEFRLPEMAAEQPTERAPSFAPAVRIQHKKRKESTR